MKKVWWSGILVVIFAMNAFLLWYYEISVQIGWEGESWMQVNQWSLYGTVALMVAAYLAPFILIRNLRRAAILKAFIELYLTTLVAFFIVRIVLLSIYNSIYGYLHFGGLMVVLGVVATLTAYSYRNISKRRLIQVVPRQLVSWLIAAFAGSILLSWLTLVLFNGFYWPGMWYLLVKSGLLFFWLTTLLGGVGGLLALYRWQVQEMRSKDILDDIADLEKPQD